MERSLARRHRPRPPPAQRSRSASATSRRPITAARVRSRLSTASRSTWGTSGTIDVGGRRVALVFQEPALPLPHGPVERQQVPRSHQSTARERRIAHTAAPEVSPAPPSWSASRWNQAPTRDRSSPASWAGLEGWEAGSCRLPRRRLSRGLALRPTLRPGQALQAPPPDPRARDAASRRTSAPSWRGP